MHILNYLNAEATKLWAERAEAQARGWRMAGFVLLLLLVVQTWLVVDTATTLVEQRRTSALKVEWLREQLAKVQDERPLALCTQQASDIDAARIAAEEKFAVCLSANAGLVEALREFDRTVKDQQLLIGDAVEMAKRCEVQPATWVARIPATSEVRW